MDYTTWWKVDYVWKTKFYVLLAYHFDVVDRWEAPDEKVDFDDGPGVCKEKGGISVKVNPTS